MKGRIPRQLSGERLERVNRLLEATDHVAPMVRMSNPLDHRCYRDAVQVVRAYVRGEVLLLDGDLMRRLAQGRYGNGRQPRPRAAAVGP